jgi:hypothetical protein
LEGLVSDGPEVGQAHFGSIDDLVSASRLEYRERSLIQIMKSLERHGGWIRIA